MGLTLSFEAVIISYFVFCFVFALTNKISRRALKKFFFLIFQDAKGSRQRKGEGFRAPARKADRAGKIFS